MWLEHLGGLRRSANPRVFDDVEPPVEQPEDRELDGRAQLDFFRAFLATLDRTVAKSAGEEADWKLIYKFVIQVVDEDHRRRGIGRYCSTIHFILESLMK